MTADLFRSLQMVARNLIFFLSLICIPACLLAQTDSIHKDSVLYTKDFKFREGIYISYEAFRNNDPVPRSSLVTTIDSSRLDQIRLLVHEEKKIKYRNSAGKIEEVPTLSLWGFSENNGVYINYNAGFFRIVVMGSLCHFTATYTDYRTTDPTATQTEWQYPVETTRQYVLDIKTGQVIDFNLPSMETIFQRDPVINAEFTALHKRKKKELLFYYLRMYNERHPLYFFTTG
jgi:hypothetical protein